MPNILVAIQNLEVREKLSYAKENPHLYSHYNSFKTLKILIDATCNAGLDIILKCPVCCPADQPANPYLVVRMCTRSENIQEYCCIICPGNTANSCSDTLLRIYNRPTVFYTCRTNLTQMAWQSVRVFTISELFSNLPRRKSWDKVSENQAQNFIHAMWVLVEIGFLNLAKFLFSAWSLYIGSNIRRQLSRDSRYAVVDDWSLLLCKEAEINWFYDVGCFNSVVDFCFHA